MALTFLDLTNRVLRRLNEVELTSSNFASARGFHAQVKDAVNAAIKDIHNSEYEWPFNHEEVDFALTPSTASYGLPADQVKVDWESFFIDASVSLNTAAKSLRFISLDQWRQELRETDNALITVEGQPRKVTSGQNNTFVLSPVPDQAYTLRYEYFKNPVELSAHDDTTTIPDTYAGIIVEGAMHYCYMFRENFESAGVAEKRFKKGVAMMRNALINRDNAVRDTRVPK
jgi:hypothetical protein